MLGVEFGEAEVQGLDAEVAEVEVEEEMFADVPDEAGAEAAGEGGVVFVVSGGEFVIVLHAIGTGGGGETDFQTVVFAEGSAEAEGDEEGDAGQFGVGGGGAALGEFVLGGEVGGFDLEGAVAIEAVAEGEGGSPEVIAEVGVAEFGKEAGEADGGVGAGVLCGGGGAGDEEGG